MATRTLDQNIGVSNLQAADALRMVGARLRDGMRALGPYGRRYILTGVGAACALGLGVSAALMVQLPSDMKDPVQAQDQTLAQTELPFQTQALANALNNPPAFAAPDDHGADVAALSDTTGETATADLDDRPTGPTVTTSTTVDDGAPAEPHAATPAVTAAPASATPTPKDDGATAN